MQIEVKGRNLPVTDELREHVEKRFEKIAQAGRPSWRELEVELREERNPANADSQVAEATLHLKGDDAARARGLARMQALDQPRRGRAGAARSSATATSAASAARRAPRHAGRPRSATGRRRAAGEAAAARCGTVRGGARTVRPAAARSIL